MTSTCWFSECSPCEHHASLRIWVPTHFSLAIYLFILILREFLCIKNEHAITLSFFSYMNLFGGGGGVHLTTTCMSNTLTSQFKPLLSGRVKLPVFPSPTAYMLTSFGGFSWLIRGIFYTNSSKTIGNFPIASIFHRSFLKLHRYICNLACSWRQKTRVGNPWGAGRCLQKATHPIQIHCMAMAGQWNMCGD